MVSSNIVEKCISSQPLLNDDVFSTSVAEPHHFSAAPVPDPCKIFDAAPDPTPAPTLLQVNFLKTNKSVGAPNYVRLNWL
jgi:hypothetical protein